MASARILFAPQLLFLCLVSAGIHAWAQPAAKQLPPKTVALLQNEVGMDDNLPSDKNPAGLKFQFSKIGESDQDQGHYSIYRAYVPGALENRKYSLALWKIGADVQILPGDVYVNAKGLLMTSKPRPEQENTDSVDRDDEFDLAIQVARGEPVRVVLATADGGFFVPGTIVPYPIESKDRACRLEARLALPQAAAVLLYADGFAPNSDVPFQSSSEGEAHTGSFHTNGKGHAATIDLPFVVGKAAGTLKVSVSVKNCAVSVEIPWGKGSYQPM